MQNNDIARRLDEVAHLLNEQDDNPYRVQAYRRAAQTLRQLDRPVVELVREQGEAGLRKLPGIGESLAGAIVEILLTGRLSILERLRGEHDPVALLASVPGIGKALAARLHNELGIDSLEELEQAAHTGRLLGVPGIGKKRRAGILDSLATRLGRARTPLFAADLPPVEELLDVDREYREKAAAGRLRTIAPRRFNPRREACLPVLHTARGRRHYTALFSNTARAHQTGNTRDWVVLYYDDGKGEQQATVMTCARGPLKGRRVVRGREGESRRDAPQPQASFQAGA
ncbi:MAG TPA: helix-hairpin-helix domain-containing protein [Candidatus Binatia bacterium]|nr:helix-hairpin-helix domain-containing protein [Candidatus Binatia bacterium]